MQIIWKYNETILDNFSNYNMANISWVCIILQWFQYFHQF